MTKVTLTKIEAAKLQLNAAVRMFSINEEPIAIHTVACASFEVINDLMKHNQMSSVFDEILSNIKEEKQREFKKMWRETQNFAKHADKDPEGTLDYSPEALEHYLFFICFAYQNYTKKHTVETGAYMVWFGFRHPEVYTGTLQQKLLEYTRDFGATDFSDRAPLKGLMEDVRENLAYTT